MWGNDYRWYFWGAFHIDNYVKVGTQVNSTPAIRNTIVGLMEHGGYNQRDKDAVVAVQIVWFVDGFRQARLIVYEGNIFQFYRSLSVGTYDNMIPSKASQDQMYAWVGWSETCLWPAKTSMPTLRVAAKATAPINKSTTGGASDAAPTPPNQHDFMSMCYEYPIDLGNKIWSYISSRHYGNEDWSLVQDESEQGIYYTTDYYHWWW